MIIKEENIRIRFMKGKVLVLIILGIIFSYCGKRIPKIPEMYSPSAQTYIRRCMSCHTLPHPSQFDIQRWIKIINVMKKRMEERNHPPLTEEEEKMILDYLKKYARR